MNQAVKWGVIATAKAPAYDILRFAAHHLDAGAARVHVFLDERNPQAFKALKSHPKCRVTVCDAAHWQRLGGNRPAKHQVRQSRNATFGFRRAKNLDWIMHLDIDEYLLSARPVAGVLAALPEHCTVARIRPIEALAHPQSGAEPKAFKAFVPGGPDRLQTALRLYPTYGLYIKGGFVSHVAGKVFARTSLAKVDFRIHNVLSEGAQNPGQQECPEIELAHCHATSWEDWYTRHVFRLERGSYRADMAPALPENLGGATLHALFSQLKAERGDAGLRAFFDEVCADTPEHRTRLQQEGLLRLHDLDLDAKMSFCFPNHAG